MSYSWINGLLFLSKYFKKRLTQFTVVNQPHVQLLFVLGISQQQKKIDTLGWNTSKTNWCQISYCEEFNSLEYNSAVKGHQPFVFALWWKICSPLHVVITGFHLSWFLFIFWLKWSFVIWNLPDHQWLF